MAFPNVSDIIATTLEQRSGQIADSVTLSNALLTWLSKRGNIRTFSGGRLIYEELSFAENANGGWYSGYDTLPVAAADVISAAEYNIKQYAVPVTISGLEELQNAGKEAIVDLMEARIKVAESTMANDISVGLYSDGTGSGGKTIGGLDAAVPDDPTTGTYGGINRANYTFWQPQVYDTGAVASSATIQAAMNELWADCVRGADRPDLIIAGEDTWVQYMASLQAIQRFTSAESAKLGFSSIKFMDADVVLDGASHGGGAAADNMYFLNTKYIHFRPHKNRNMVPLSPEKRYAVNQDASVTILAWAGNLTLSASRFHGRLRCDA